MTAITDAMHRLPLAAIASIIFDQGSEFADFLKLERRRKRQRRMIKTYYCCPRTSWQKGSVENFNKRFRRYLPKDFDIRPCKQLTLNKITRWMNNTLRKFLAFMAPAKAFSQCCAPQSRMCLTDY